MNAHISYFEKLDVLQNARSLNKNIYEVTKNFPKDETYGLTNQIRRASISICSNIAEGSSRHSSKDQAHFTSITYSSAMEVLNQLIIASDLNYITTTQLSELRNQLTHITNQLNNLRKAQLSRHNK
ncbi:four helix bundle protein [Lentisphaera marina]|uniref:four helix bundle protein n=1 Tax=Lentisphaera marina TaxID=1111041 RepID=UPI00236646CC|nr:four helix bundle protein [Lentisphaera marina]MDD7986884.1 four helix bundle protein [Lentisphaera marina]